MDPKQPDSPQDAQRIRGAMSEDELRQGLSDESSYVSFEHSSTTVLLDGEFTASDLENIAAFMRSIGRS